MVKICDKYIKENKRLEQEWTKEQKKLDLTIEIKPERLRKSQDLWVSQKIMRVKMDQRHLRLDSGVFSSENERIRKPRNGKIVTSFKYWKKRQIE